MEVDEAPAAVPTANVREEWKGMAKIKAEYLIAHHVRELDPQFLSAADQAQMLPVLKNEEPAGEPEVEDKADTVDPVTGRGPRLKGRNKNRSKHLFRETVKVCSYVLRHETCPYQEKCRFSHKTEDYLSQKLPDIGEVCPNFARKGHCSYGITCRFASAHLTPDGNNIVPEGIHLEHSNSDEINTMSKQLQQVLRKRKYEFPVTPNQKLPKMLNFEEPEISEMEACLSEAREETERNLTELVPAGSVTDEGEIRLRLPEIKQLNFRGKLYLSPLTTVGNLPYRRICKRLGADITCGEMALAANLLGGQQSEWALMVRHSSEDIFGVQVCGSKPDVMERLAHLLKSEISVDFVDINAGCPIDMVCNSGSGCALMSRLPRLQGVVSGMANVLEVPLTIKMRTGIHDNKNTAHEIIPKLAAWGASQAALHGRSRDQRYTKNADWEYIAKCAEIASPLPLLGNGDCMDFEEYYEHMENSKIAGILIARGALIKPWIFTEIKERRHWDISAQERFDIFKDYANFGLEHWGSDTRGVENTRRFLLEWMSFTHRYIPVGVLERVPQRINERPPHYQGRSELESLLSSSHCNDWIKVSQMLLGPVPDGFKFLPKHKANAWK